MEEKPQRLHTIGDLGAELLQEYTPLKQELGTLFLFKDTNSRMPASVIENVNKFFDGDARMLNKIHGKVKDEQPLSEEDTRAIVKEFSNLLSLLISERHKLPIKRIQKAVKENIKGQIEFGHMNIDRTMKRRFLWVSLIQSIGGLFINPTETISTLILTLSASHSVYAERPAYKEALERIRIPSFFRDTITSVRGRLLIAVLGCGIGIAGALTSAHHDPIQKSGAESSLVRGDNPNTNNPTIKTVKNNHQDSSIEDSLLEQPVVSVSQEAESQSDLQSFLRGILIINRMYLFLLWHALYSQVVHTERKLAHLNILPYPPHIDNKKFLEKIQKLISDLKRDLSKKDFYKKSEVEIAAYVEKAIHAIHEIEAGLDAAPQTVFQRFRKKLKRWCSDKDNKLQRERDISFEEVLHAIDEDQLLDIVVHHDLETHPNQKICIVQKDGNVYQMPFVDGGKEVFLKSIFPAVKAEYLYAGEVAAVIPNNRDDLKALRDISSFSVIRHIFMEFFRKEKIIAPSDMTTAESISAEDETLHTQHGVIELTSLLNNPEFRNAFIKAGIQPKQHELTKRESSWTDAARRPIRSLIEREALRLLNKTSLDEAKKLGKGWGDALRSVTQVEFEGVQYPILGMTNPDLEIRFKQDCAQSYEPRVIQAKEQVEAERVLKEAEFDNAQQQLKFLINLPDTDPRKQDLIAAMNTWGKSPNVNQSRGENNQGFHAGMVHYFEYRGDPEKNGRYKKEAIPFGIDGFITYSQQLQKLLTLEENSNIKRAALIEDEQGQRRSIILTNEDSLIIAFQKSNEPMRVVTVLPYQKEKVYTKRVEEELNPNPNSPVRLNNLEGERTIIQII